MPKFLSADEIYRILQRELPEGVYPDGPKDRFFSTAENYSVASGISDSQVNLTRIYDNYFPNSADEKIADWEITVFARNLPTSLSLAERRDRIVTKMRSRKGIRKEDMIAIVKGVIGSDKQVEIAEWGCSSGGWMLNESQLNIETILNGQALVDVTGSVICEDSPSDHGKTQEEWDEMLEEAYTYEVLIYDYTLTELELIELEESLNEAEPARSNHVITDGLDPADALDGES